MTRAAVRHRFIMCTDIAPTIMEIVGAKRPRWSTRHVQMPVHGTRLAYSSARGGSEPTHNTLQYFEMFGHAASGPAAGRPSPINEPMGASRYDVWELYHLDRDFSECHDVPRTSGKAEGDDRSVRG